MKLKYNYELNTDNISFYYKTISNNGNKNSHYKKIDKDSHLNLLETEEPINNMETASKYLSRKIFSLLNNDDMKTIHADFFSSKIELFVSKNKKDYYIMNMYFNLNSYKEILDNKNDFMKEFLKLKLPQLTTFNLNQLDDINIEIALIYTIHKNEIDTFINNLFYVNYKNIIDFFIDYVSLYSDDYLKFTEDINTLTDYRNYFLEISNKEYKIRILNRIFA